MQSSLKQEVKKAKSEIVFNKEFKILENLVPLYYKDDEHLIAKDTKLNDRTIYKVNLKNETKEKIDVGFKITAVIGVCENGDIYITDDECIYSVDKSSFKLKKLLDDKEVVLKIREDFVCNQQSVEKGYVGYYKQGNEIGIYELINLNTGKKYELKRYNERIINSLLVEEPYVYYRSNDTINRFNLESCEVNTIKTNKHPLIMGKPQNGNVVVEDFNEDEWKSELYRIDFTNNKQTKYEEMFNGEDTNYDFRIEQIDVKNNFVYYEKSSKDNKGQVELFLGIIEGEKIKIKNKLFKNREEGKKLNFKVISNIKNQDKVIVTLINESVPVNDYYTKGVDIPTKNYNFDLN